MEEVLEMFIKAAQKRKNDNEKNFRIAEELGLRQGDIVIFKDGDVECINHPDRECIRFKQIAEVRRPTRWMEFEIQKPKRKKKGAN